MLKLQDIKLVAYDFDGVMTDNRVMIDSEGKEYVFVNRADGLAVSIFKSMGIKQVIISSEKNPLVLKRAQKLNIECISNVSDKKRCLQKYLKTSGIDRKKVIFVGNDINDLDVMNYVGYPIAPCDADQNIKNIARFITKAKGGRGVVREILGMFGKASAK
jgi:3-deoxy-D-manno-octulosonate 8-phosphate phosphatase (KDO 8-P phosphatase)